MQSCPEPCFSLQATRAHLQSHLFSTAPAALSPAGFTTSPGKPASHGQKTNVPAVSQELSRNHARYTRKQCGSFLPTQPRHLHHGSFPWTQNFTFPGVPVSWSPHPPPSGAQHSPQQAKPQQMCCQHLARSSGQQSHREECPGCCSPLWGLEIICSHLTRNSPFFSFQSDSMNGFCHAAG